MVVVYPELVLLVPVVALVVATVVVAWSVVLSPVVGVSPVPDVPTFSVGLVNVSPVPAGQAVSVDAAARMNVCKIFMVFRRYSDVRIKRPVCAAI